jgi:hypothetical protein
MVIEVNQLLSKITSTDKTKVIKKLMHKIVNITFSLLKLITILFICMQPSNRETYLVELFLLLLLNYISIIVWDPFHIW